MNETLVFVFLFSCIPALKAPEVSLLQKSSSSPVECHATGFYPAGVTITWLRNGQDYHEDVYNGELLPNEDETFQKTSILNVPPDDWKKHQYVCVVEHETGTIRKILTEDKIISNYGPLELYIRILTIFLGSSAAAALFWIACILHKKKASYETKV